MAMACLFSLGIIMKKKNYNILISSAISVVLILTGIVVYIFASPPTPRRVFENAIRSVVELRAFNLDASNDYEVIDETFGTAVLIERNGYFITNAHVVTYSRLGMILEFMQYQIRFAFEDEFREVELVRFCSDLDLAILRASNLPNRARVIRHGNSDRLHSGDTVYAVGNSQNNGLSISQGIVGIPLINIVYQNLIRKVIQSDITITSGNSGGALLDRNGRLIGITTFRIRDTQGQVVFGIAYSIPLRIVNGFIDDVS